MDKSKRRVSQSSGLLQQVLLRLRDYESSEIQRIVERYKDDVSRRSSRRRPPPSL